MSCLGGGGHGPLPQIQQQYFFLPGALAEVVAVVAVAAAVVVATVAAMEWHYWYMWWRGFLPLPVVLDACTVTV